MKYLFSVTLIVFLFLTSCQPEGRVFVEHKKLSPNIEWLKKDSREFKVLIEDNSINYDFKISFRFANGYQYKTANIVVKEISPSGKETSNNYELTIRNESGEYIGDPGYDIWDSEHLVVPSKKFEESGTYTYIIEHDMPKAPLHFAMEVGIVVDKAK